MYLEKQINRRLLLLSNSLLFVSVIVAKISIDGENYGR